MVLQGGIGDTVHGLPIVNALKRADAARHITWVVQPTPAPLLRPHPAVDELVPYDHTRGLAAVRELWHDLRSRSFDVVLNCGIYFKSAVPTVIARAPHKVGYGPDRANDLVWLTANHRLPPRGGQHWQDMYLQTLEFLDVARDPLEWRIMITEEERAAQLEFFENLQADRVVGIVTTSGGTARNWLTERFAELATAVERDLDFRIVLLGGPGVVEQRRAREVAGRTEAEVVWALGPDLRRLVYLTDGCDLVIAPDTGPLHIARALETPVIGLYGHSDPLRAGPYRKYEDLTIDRYNYDAAGIPYSGPVERQHPARAGARAGRMGLISVADVLEKVDVALQRYITRAR